MAQGPEDSPNWGHPANSAQQKPAGRCHSCKAVIGLSGGRHCSQPGCPWCAICGRKIETKKEK